MERLLHTARLERKLLLSERTQCYHLEFSVDGLEAFPFEAGQFISTVVTDSRGKSQTRAYSIASAPRGRSFDLCLNRVENGFFSNLLCDLEPGQTVPFHGPHGMFLLRHPLTDAILIATGTGIAPMRGFVEQLFPEDRPEESQPEEPQPDRTGGKVITLVYGTRHPSELYYADYFERIAARHPNFRYIATLSRPDESWAGPRGYVQEHVEAIVRAHPSFSPEAPAPAAEAPAHFAMHAYICGLNEMVAANRERLKSLGWQRKQIIFERYD